MTHTNARTDTHSPTCTYMGTGTHACGKPTVAGKSYCAEHVHLVYQKGTANGKRKKDIRRAHTIQEIISDMNEVYAELLAEGEISEA